VFFLGFAMIIACLLFLLLYSLVSIFSCCRLPQVLQCFWCFGGDMQRERQHSFSLVFYNI
jgi:hypothetical protein